MHLKMSSAEVVCCKKLPNITDNLSIEANSVDPEQTAPVVNKTANVSYLNAWSYCMLLCCLRRLQGFWGYFLINFFKNIQEYYQSQTVWQQKCTSNALANYDTLKISCDKLLKICCNQ